MTTYLAHYNYRSEVRAKTLGMFMIALYLTTTVAVAIFWLTVYKCPNCKKIKGRWKSSAKKDDRRPGGHYENSWLQCKNCNHRWKGNETFVNDKPRWIQ
jgi:DNA-directed RNA polymerase subunit RPC12/RpoP